MGRPYNAVGAGVFGDAASSGRWRRVVGTHEGVERALEAFEERHGSSAAAAGTAAARGSLKSAVVVFWTTQMERSGCMCDFWRSSLVYMSRQLLPFQCYKRHVRDTSSFVNPLICR